MMNGHDMLGREVVHKVVSDLAWDVLLTAWTCQQYDVHVCLTKQRVG